ncbi:MAG: exosortase-dependent surface protein XDP2, partial [Phormidesmis sp.]
PHPIQSLRNTMKIRQLLAGASLLASGAITLSSAPAQAFSFQTNYTAALTGKDASKGDITLNSVTLSNGKVLSDFTLINSANILSNDIYTSGNSGAASADIGDKATTGLKQESATNAGIRTVLNNKNLNNIIDTEDKGNFILDLFFEKPVDNIFLWERGMNSRLDVQALDAKGNVIGNLLKLNSKSWDYAGYSIDTKEISSAQKVGSIGVSLADLGLTSGYVNALRVSSYGKAYNGPDFKVMGSVAEVPEPSALLGLGTVVVGALVTRRRKRAQAA